MDGMLHLEPDAIAGQRAEPLFGILYAEDFDEPGAGIELEDLEAGGPEHEAGYHEQSGQREERAVRDARDERTEHEQGAHDREDVHERHTRSVSDT